MTQNIKTIQEAEQAVDKLIDDLNEDLPEGMRIMRVDKREDITLRLASLLFAQGRSLTLLHRKVNTLDKFNAALFLAVAGQFFFILFKFLP